MIAPLPALDDVLAGSKAAVARLITAAERGRADAVPLLGQVYARSGRAHIVGVTGIPGGGKSTLVAGMTATFRERGLTVGVVAIDPSSPYSGGAILGDRVRMDRVASDPGVFIRSMSSRGALGGLARTSADAVAVLDAAGYDIVVLETVGVGQDEVSIASASHTTLVVSVPGTGDEIQALKAGVLEIADVHVVNKADRDGAHRLVAQLEEMLHYAPARTAWEVPVLQATAEAGEGVHHLCDVVEEHRESLRTTAELHRRERLIAETRIRDLVHSLLEARLTDPGRDERMEDVVEQVARRLLPPLAAAEHLLDETLPRRAS